MMENGAESNFLVGANYALKNSLMLRKSSAILDAHGNCGHAIALVVLSAEEAIKAIDLCVKASGLFEGAGILVLDEKNTHKARHISARVISLVVHHVLEMANTVDLNKITLRDAVMRTIVNMVDNIKNGVLTDEMQSEMNFWKNANHLKNRGLYVDEKSGQWLSPTSLEKADYQKANSFADGIIRRARIVRILFRDMGRHTPDFATDLNILKVVESIDEKELGISE